MHGIFTIKIKINKATKNISSQHYENIGTNNGIKTNICTIFKCIGVFMGREPCKIQRLPQQKISHMNFLDKILSVTPV